MIIVGIIMLAVGLILAICGINIGNDELSNLNSGVISFGDILIYVGIIIAVLGTVYIVIASVKKSKTPLPPKPVYPVFVQAPFYPPVQTIFFCSNCGARLDFDAKFCPACGTEVK